jgi:hypothetical protein
LKICSRAAALVAALSVIALLNSATADADVSGEPADWLESVCYPPFKEKRFGGMPNSVWRTYCTPADSSAEVILVGKYASFTALTNDVLTYSKTRPRAFATTDSGSAWLFVAVSTKQDASSSLYPLDDFGFTLDG